MDPRRRIVTRLPLSDLWDGFGRPVDGRCIGAITRDEVRQLLVDKQVHFVIADVGQPLQWIDKDERYDVWRRTSDHIAPDPNRLDLGSSGWLYLAWRWQTAASGLVIVLQRFH